ncbi:FIST N-terminal domain-containing protein [Methanolobus sp. ZRKC3]|uniref:FIST signal transduction protein n=1 Tax=Methanolobus sp. ZRKC3 TaxID=3125786 RepID=UPI003249A5AC
MYVSNAAAENLVEDIKMMAVSSSETVMILIGEESPTDIDSLIEQLNELDIDFFGGIFPGLIHKTDMRRSGAVIQKFPYIQKPLIIRDLDTDGFLMPEFSEGLLDINTKYTVMILTDGLTGNISLLLSRISNQLGNSFNYIGGGAGFSSFEREACVFTGAGFFKDAAVIVPIKMETELGVGHGFELLIGPLVITKASQNKVEELNWKNAFEVYGSLIETATNNEVSIDGLRKEPKLFPLGIHCKGNEDIAREVIAVNNNSELVCVGSIPENAIVNILHGTKTGLLNESSRAAISAMTTNKASRNDLIIECISRKMILKDEMNMELESINDILVSVDEKNIPEGVVSLGEISSYGEGVLEYFNETVVIGRFHDK